MIPIESLGERAAQMAVDRIRDMKEKKEARRAGGQSEEAFLADYRRRAKSAYEKPSVTVDMLIFTVADKKTARKQALPDKELKILLVKRGGHPFMGDWALPGGFVGMDESVDDAAARELREETNVEDIYMEQLFTWGDVKRDPRLRVISVSYMALIDSAKVRVLAGSDAEECRWFTVSQEKIVDEAADTIDGFVRHEKYLLTLKGGDDEMLSLIKKETGFKQNNALGKSSLTILDSAGIAFDHAKIISYGLERLVNKLDYTTIAFNLVPRYFTITSLQKIYEAILGKPLLAPNFRRKIAPMVRETKEVEKGVHRPAKLYEYNPAWHLASFE